MNKKLYIYSIILAVVYTIFLGHCLYDHAYAGFRGGLLGIKEHASSLSYELLGGYLLPKEGLLSFPSSITNEMTGESMQMEIRESFIFMKQIPDNIPFYAKLLKISSYLLIYAFFALFIYLPFIASKIMKSIPKNEFYSIVNINRIRKVSYVILLMFLLYLVANFFMYISLGFYASFREYKFVMGEYNYSLLFLGLTILILSEILRYTTSIKEEQEFTI
jgi:hypothetical protein